MNTTPASIICAQLGEGWEPLDANTASCGIAMVSGDAANGWRARITPSDSLVLYSASSQTSPVTALRLAHDKMVRARTIAEREERVLVETLAAKAEENLADFSVVPGIASVNIKAVVRNGSIVGMGGAVDAMSRPLADGVHEFTVHIPTI